MKKVMIALAILEIGYGIYSIYQGEPFNDQITLFIMGILLIGSSFTVGKKQKNKSSN